MLLGLTEPTSGTARVDGVIPTRDPLLVKSRVGYLPDEVGFYEDLTARQNLRYTAELNRLPARDGRRPHRRPARATSGWPTTPTARSAAYSRGMRQRLGLADALVKDPSILDPRRADGEHRPRGRARAAAARRAAAHRPGRDGPAVVAPAAPGRAGVRPHRRLRRRPAGGVGHDRRAGRRARRPLGVHRRRDRARRRRAARSPRSPASSRCAAARAAGSSRRRATSATTSSGAVFDAGGSLTHLARDGADLDAIYHRYFRSDEAAAGPVTGRRRTAS